MHMCGGTHAKNYVFRSENYLWEPILYFYHVDLRDPTQVRLGSKCLYPLSHLTGPG